MSMKRRDMLKMSFSSMAYFSTLATTPTWITKAAQALPEGAAFNDRILVVLQHAGGIDGLNTVIPRQDPVYYDAETRPTIQVPPGSEINLDGLNGFHPQLARLADWYQQGQVGILQNIGYLNPNLSHFTSTDIFEFAQNPLKTPRPAGWVGRFYDNACDGCEPGALDMVVAGKTSVPDSMDGFAFFRPPAINRPSDYSFEAHQDEALRLNAIRRMNLIPQVDPELDFLQRSANNAQASVTEIARAAELEPLVAEEEMYSNDSLGRGLQLVSQIIRSGFNTKIFYVSQSGYDTHANQVAAGMPLEQGSHPRLLERFDRNVSAFLTEMQLTGNLDRVMVMTFSEFGRRIRENGSRGTDHGAANCSFVFGGGVNGGVYGGQPDLEDSIKGSLRYKIDFRSVYSQVIENWFGQEAAPVFGSDIYADIISPDLASIPFVKNPAN